VLVFEVVPIEWKWRDIQSRGGVGGVTFSRPGKSKLKEFARTLAELFSLHQTFLLLNI
jgi:hypothetical protein